MKTSSLLSSLLLAIGLTGASLTAATTVVNFDDLSGVQSGAALTNYHGLNFDGNFFSYDSPDDPFNAASGLARVAANQINTSVAESFFTFVTPGQIFLGAYFAGYDFTEVSFNLYHQGSLVATSSLLNPTDTPTWLASGYQGLVDSVGVVGERGYFVMDDVTYQSVPETATTLGLLAGALLTLGFVRRSRLV